jgi:hypothetical protein
VKTIHKYPFAAADQIEIDMPKGAELLCVREQHETLCLWALVDTNQPPYSRTLLMYGTGHDLDNTNTEKYVGTVFEAGGHLVWHVFDLGERAL